jgi:RND family efflux transporter MFP subunit
MSTATTTAEVSRDRNEQATKTAAAHNEATVAGGRRARRWVRTIGVLVVLLLGGALLAGALFWRQREEATATAAEAEATPLQVTVASARRLSHKVERVLPGTALPLMEAAIFARTTGYLKTRRVDIGDRVEQGQLLAEISAPDVDDQLAQARANLELARANLLASNAHAELAEVLLERDRSAGVGTAVTFQQIDVGRAAVKTTATQTKALQASIQVHEATVQRLTDLQNFQKITAPFPGVITARNVDPGDLITADNASTTGELFHLMRTDVLRVFVNVPQTFATSVKTGQDAVVYRRSEPEKQYAGKVTRAANALDRNTRTLLTQVDVPNPDGSLRPGMSLKVKFVFDRELTSIVVPSAARRVTSAGKQCVAVLDDQHRVQYRTVKLGQDNGAEVEVVAGLKGGEVVVVHPEDLPEGTVVDPVPLADKQAR